MAAAGQSTGKSAALIFGAFVCLGLVLLGFQLAGAAIEFKQFDRAVTVKGLSEREYSADIVIWPIQFTDSGNDLQALYQSVESKTIRIREFLMARGIAADAISSSTPAVTDRLAQQYGGGPRPEFRYTALQTVTVYSEEIAAVRQVMTALAELGKEGIVFTAGDYQSQTEYLFTRLNAVKPEMIEEATRNAREVAMKFAADSDSRLGKIKRASQGQFSIQARDKNNPHIKKVRVVSTIEYYLSD